MGRDFIILCDSISTYVHVGSQVLSKQVTVNNTGVFVYSNELNFCIKRRLLGW
jgi:hypothetical protein